MRRFDPNTKSLESLSNCTKNHYSAGPPLAVPDHVIDNDIGGHSDDENAWDYWEN
jgi:hypothetical protein